MDEALEMLREGERRQWLIADWSWHISNRGHGGVYIGLIRDEKSQGSLEDPGWTVRKGDCLTGFSKWWENGEERTEYGYEPVSGDSWPLVIHRNFYGLAQDQYDLLEEFRLFHNLWHDRKTDDYYKIIEDGEKRKIVFRDPSGAMFVDTAAIRQFCGARGLKVLLQVDAVQFFSEPQKESLNEFEEPALHAIRHISNGSISDCPAFGRLLGKRLIDVLPKERCGIWPYEREKQCKRPNNPILRRPADMLRSPQKQGGLYARQFHSIWPSPKQGRVLVGAHPKVARQRPEQGRILPAKQLDQACLLLLA
jgi:hypothetical protein